MALLAKGSHKMQRYGVVPGYFHWFNNSPPPCGHEGAQLKQLMAQKLHSPMILSNNVFLSAGDWTHSESRTSFLLTLDYTPFVRFSGNCRCNWEMGFSGLSLPLYLALSSWRQWLLPILVLVGGRLGRRRAVANHPQPLTTTEGEWSKAIRWTSWGKAVLDCTLLGQVQHSSHYTRSEACRIEAHF